jgi:hypothetical protein
MQAADFPLPASRAIAPASPVQSLSPPSEPAVATSNTPVAAPSVSSSTPPAVSLLATLSSAADASAYFQRALAHVFDFLLAIDWQTHAVELGPPPALAPAPAAAAAVDAGEAVAAAPASSSPAFALVPSTFTRERRDLMPILLPYSSLAIPRKKNSARSLTPLTKEFILRTSWTCTTV